jgi:hypothetical protein
VTRLHQFSLVPSTWTFLMSRHTHYRYRCLHLLSRWLTFLPASLVLAPLFSACYRPQALTFDSRTVQQAVATFLAPPFLPVPLVLVPPFLPVPVDVVAGLGRLPMPQGIRILKRSVPVEARKLPFPSVSIAYGLGPTAGWQDLVFYKGD